MSRAALGELGVGHPERRTPRKWSPGRRVLTQVTLYREGHEGVAAGARGRGSRGQGAEEDPHGGRGAGAVGRGRRSWREGSAFLKSSLSQKNPRFSKSKDGSPPTPPPTPVVQSEQGPAATACPRAARRPPLSGWPPLLLQISAMTLRLTLLLSGATKEISSHFPFMAPTRGLCPRRGRGSGRPGL